MNRIDKLLQAVEHMKNKTHLLCKTKEGELKTMNLLDAISTGATFIDSIDGNHEFDELYKALLDDDPSVFDLPEV